MAKIEGNYARVKLLQLELNTAMKANAFGLIAAAAVALIAVFVKLYERMKEVREAQQVLNNIKKEAVSRAQEQIDKVNLLVAAARNENLSLKERQQAVENLNKIIPGYNAQIDATTGKLREGTQALKDYIEQLKRKYEVEGAKEMLAQIGKRRAELKIEKAELQKEKEDMDRVQRELESQNSTGTQAYGVAGVTMAQTTAIGSTARRHRVNSGIADADRELAQLDARERTITGEYGDDIQRDAVATSTPKSSGGGGGTAAPPSGSSGDSSGGSTAKEDKFEKEKEWKEREEALNRIAYAKGEKDYAEYQQRMEEIAIQYAQKKLEHTDLTENERLSIQAEYYEAVRKQSENAEKRSVEEENAAYNEQLAVLKQRFIDGESTQKVYEEAAEQLEIAHLQKLVSLYEEGSKEYLQAQKSLQDKLLANQKKHQKEAEDAEKKHQEALKKMKAEYFGDNPQERQSKFAADLALLTEVYNAEVRAAGDNAKERLRIEKAFQQAKLALMEKYNIEGRRANMNALQRWNEDLQDFLDSDVGKAVEGSVDVLVSGMSSIFSQLSSIVSAELEIQTAAIEKKYDREISLAEGNNYKVKQLEKQKEAKMVKAKNLP